MVGRWLRWRVGGLGFGSSVGCDSVVAVLVVVILTECCGSGFCFGVRRWCVGIGGRLCVGSGGAFGVWGLGLVGCHWLSGVCCCEQCCPRWRLCWPILGRHCPA